MSPSDNSEILKFSESIYAYSIKDFQEPGFYKLSDGSKVLQTIPVNVHPNEYKSEQLERKSISSYFRNINFINNIDKSRDLILNNLRGSEIWNYLIMLLCFLFIIEMYLYAVFLNDRK